MLNVLQLTSSVSYNYHLLRFRVVPRIDGSINIIQEYFNGRSPPSHKIDADAMDDDFDAAWDDGTNQRTGTAHVTTCSNMFDVTVSF